MSDKEFIEWLREFLKETYTDLKESHGVNPYYIDYPNSILLKIINNKLKTVDDE